MQKLLKSLGKNKKGIFLIVLSSIFACVGQLFWKMFTTNGIWFLVLGMMFYAVGALLMLIAYKFGKLSVLQPFLSLNYVLSIVLGFLVLSEQITINKIIGITIIMIGVILVGGGDQDD